MTIKIIAGEYTGRIFHADNVSIDGRYVQVWICHRLEEFKVGFDCVVIK